LGTKLITEKCWGQTFAVLRYSSALMHLWLCCEFQSILKDPEGLHNSCEACMLCTSSAGAQKKSLGLFANAHIVPWMLTSARIRE